MGVSKSVTVTCDYGGCKNVKGGSAVLSWNMTEAEAGRIPPPDESKYLVLLNLNGNQLAFCCQLHAAEYFLPPGYEAVQKKVIELPKRPVGETEPPWLSHKLDQPMVLRPENESVPQPDGDSTSDEDPGGGPLDTL